MITFAQASPPMESPNRVVHAPALNASLIALDSQQEPFHIFSSPTSPHCPSREVFIKWMTKGPARGCYGMKNIFLNIYAHLWPPQGKIALRLRWVQGIYFRVTNLLMVVCVLVAADVVVDLPLSLGVHGKSVGHI